MSRKKTVEQKGALDHLNQAMSNISQTLEDDSVPVSSELKTIQRGLRNIKIKWMKAMGDPVTIIAEETGVSIPHVYHVLKQLKEPNQ
jgi:hypothetical protein